MINEFQPRYTPGRYRDCPWCHGRGCVACDDEADKAYRAAFPDGPQPIDTFDRSSQADMERLAQFLSDLVLNPEP